ncbi:MAG: serine/threonine protein kinase, partial [Myxococcales bacterium]|nr:serine/threonine protein kinase [Myxococcales bacterium]
MPSPRTLGKYHVLERLAATPLAEIFKVKTVGIAGFEKVQVLSRVTPGYSQDPAFARAFVEEAKIAFSLNHRNIVQVFEFGKVDGELFLATEYIPGVNLREVLRVCRERETTLPVGLACYLMGEVAAGLEYAHRKTDQWGQALGVVHCDLCPLNIACSFEGSVKILDFGSARAAYQTVPYLERHLELPHYMSPEQVSGEQLAAKGFPGGNEVDALSDIFSFGTILWELLTGTPLFGGDTIAEVHEAIVDGPMPTPRTFNHDVPDSLDDVTMRCLERKPERRFTSANDLQLELHRIQRDVGAVIGSRALSTFLGELLPDYPDTRDVRQESIAGSEDRLATRRRDEGNRMRRGESLIDAAA